jgi:hypothetical protein
VGGAEFDGVGLIAVRLLSSARTVKSNGYRLVASASPSLRPSAEWWPLRGGF